MLCRREVPCLARQHQADHAGLAAAGWPCAICHSSCVSLLVTCCPQLVSSTLRKPGVPLSLRRRPCFDRCAAALLRTSPAMHVNQPRHALSSTLLSTRRKRVDVGHSGNRHMAEVTVAGVPGVCPRHIRPHVLSLRTAPRLAAWPESCVRAACSECKAPSRGNQLCGCAAQHEGRGAPTPHSNLCA